MNDLSKRGLSVGLLVAYQYLFAPVLFPGVYGVRGGVSYRFRTTAAVAVVSCLDLFFLPRFFLPGVPTFDRRPDRSNEGTKWTPSFAKACGSSTIRFDISSESRTVVGFSSFACVFFVRHEEEKTSSMSLDEVGRFSLHRCRCIRVSCR